MTPPTGVSCAIRRVIFRWIRDETGSATIATLGCIIAVIATVVTLASVAAIVCDHHRAQVAADMAAYSAAFAHALGEPPCPEAERVAQLNHAVVTGCTVSDGDVTVSVQVRTRTARARAGPL